MAQFKKGQSGNPTGRPRGTPNKATVEVQKLCQRMVGEKAYRQRLAERLLRGRIAPGVEQMLWFYAYGKPKDVVELEAHLQFDDAQAIRESIKLKLDSIAERVRASEPVA